MKTWRRLYDDPRLWERYFVRERVIKKIRRFFEKEAFHEIETPILIPHPPAESYLDVFETTLLNRQRKGTKAYLSTSPEIPLKKLMVAGLGDCYSLTHAFRNMETQGKLHNPEFTILEWYRVGADYYAMMDDCEKLIHSIMPKLVSPWERITVAEAFKKYADVNFDEFFGHAEEITRKKGYTIGTWEQMYNQIFLNEIEPRLGRGKPTILYEFPSELAALAKKKDTDPRFAERFELYIGGLELADAYSELTDPVEQEERFKKEMAEIKRLGKTTYDYDHDFIEALKVGLPKCSGIALGVDRLVMLMADVKDIADTLFFPASEEFDII